MTVALLFPGQASQEVGMGVDLRAASPAADELLYDAARYIALLLPEHCLRLLDGLARNRSPRLHALLGLIDERLESPTVADWLGGDSELAVRLTQARARAHFRYAPTSD